MPELTLSEDQRMVRESADAVLADLASSARTRTAMDSAEGYDAAVWHHIAAELGWCAIAVPEAQGGLGLGAVELVQLFEPMGRHLLCAPFFSTVALAAPLLAAFADDAYCAQRLRAIAEGRLRATAPVTLAAAGDYGDIAQSLHAHPAGSGWRLDGRIARLLDGATAESLLLPACTPGGAIAWFAVDGSAQGLRRAAPPGWDRTRRFADVTLEGAAAYRIASARCAQPGAWPIALARLCLAAEQLGGAQACLDLTLAHTSARRQFGRAIAGFQAVKHRCAQMMVAIEALRSLVQGAAAFADPQAMDGGFERESAAVLALAKDTYFDCAQEAIQLHGGVGFTWEYDPQLHLKRAQAGSHWMATAAALRADLAAGLMS